MKQPGLRIAPRCRRCSNRSVLDPCRWCASPSELSKYPPAPTDETFLEMNRRLWAESGPVKNKIGSKDAEVIHGWAVVVSPNPENEK